MVSGDVQTLLSHAQHQVAGPSSPPQQNACRHATARCPCTLARMRFQGSTVTGLPVVHRSMGAWRLTWQSCPAPLPNSLSGSVASVGEILPMPQTCQQQQQQSYLCSVLAYPANALVMLTCVSGVVDQRRCTPPSCSTGHKQPEALPGALQAHRARPQALSEVGDGQAALAGPAHAAPAGQAGSGAFARQAERIRHGLDMQVRAACLTSMQSGVSAHGHGTAVLASMGPSCILGVLSGRTEQRASSVECQNAAISTAAAAAAVAAAGVLCVPPQLGGITESLR